MREPCREPDCQRTDLFGRGLCGKHYQFYRYNKRLDEVAPRPSERTCERCGGPIKASLRQWAARYCSSRCAHFVSYEVVREARGRRHEVCARCGVSLADKRTDARFCSAKCGSLHRSTG